MGGKGSVFVLYSVDFTALIGLGNWSALIDLYNVCNVKSYLGETKILTV